MWMKVKSSPEALLKEFLKNNMIEKLKIFLCITCCLEQLFKYTSLATLSSGNSSWFVNYEMHYKLQLNIPESGIF